MAPISRALVGATLGLAAVAPPGAAAEPNPLCTADVPLERLEGFYTLMIGGGVLPGEGGVVPVGVAETYGVALQAENGRLVMQVGPHEVIFEPAGGESAEPFAVGIATADMSRPEFEAIVGCEIENLPRLVAHDGSLTYELIVYDRSGTAGSRMVGTLYRADGLDTPRVIHLRP